MALLVSPDTASPRTDRSLVQSGKQFAHDRNRVRQLSVPANHPCPVRTRTQSVAGFIPSREQANGSGNEREPSAASPQSRGVERVNQRHDCMSPVVASMSCSPCCPLRSTLHPPPGSGSFACMIPAHQTCHSETLRIHRGSQKVLILRGFHESSL